MSPLEDPEQTPLYYSLHKDRYSRQRNIRGIEDKTNRKLIIYIANASHPGGSINRGDISAFGDLLADKKDVNLDLMLQSPGGDIDIAEKLVYMCRNQSEGFRVIIPERAKSAATLIALAADSIVMGYTSELGPIDPQVTVTTPDGKTISRPAQSFLDGLDDIKEKVEEEGGLSPAYYPLLQQLDPGLIDFCNKAKKRAESFAKKWLKQYMYSENPEEAEEIAKKLGDAKTYLSHGAVIDAKQAKEKLKLKVDYLDLITPYGRPFGSYIVIMNTSFKPENL